MILYYKQLLFENFEKKIVNIKEEYGPYHNSSLQFLFSVLFFASAYICQKMTVNAKEREIRVNE